MSFPEVAVIISDDTRQELGGKLTIVGIYTAEMQFLSPEMPNFLPRLSFTFLFSWPDEASREQVALEVYFPGEENEPGIQFVVDPNAAPAISGPFDEKKRLLANLVAEMIPLKSTGVFRVYASVGDERKEIYKLRVRHVGLNALDSKPSEALEFPHSD